MNLECGCLDLQISAVQIAPDFLIEAGQSDQRAPAATTWSFISNSLMPASKSLATVVYSALYRK